MEPLDGAGSESKELEFQAASEQSRPPRHGWAAKLARKMTLHRKLTTPRQMPLKLSCRATRSPPRLGYLVQISAVIRPAASVLSQVVMDVEREGGVGG